MLTRLRQWVQSIVHKLISIEDTPQRKALGLGLGVFLGNFPGVGPLAAWMGAYLLKVNQAAALVGSFLTNTWLTFFTLILSAKLGSFLRGEDWQQVEKNLNDILHNLSWQKLSSPIVFNTVISILLGYLVVSLILGILAYWLALYFFNSRKFKSIKE